MVTLVATIAVFGAGAWLLLSGAAPEYQGFGAVLMVVAAAGLVVAALISRARRRGGAPDRGRRRSEGAPR